MTPAEWDAHYKRVGAENARARAWWAWREQLQRITERLINKDEDWLIPEDEAMVECCVELVLDGQAVAENVTALVTYFGLDHADAAALHQALTAAQAEHMADPQAQATRRIWASSSNPQPLHK